MHACSLLEGTSGQVGVPPLACRAALARRCRRPRARAQRCRDLAHCCTLSNNPLLPPTHTLRLLRRLRRLRLRRT